MKKHALKEYITSYFLIIFFFAVFSIVYALYVQYYLNIQPCILCLYQRIPYYIIIISSILYYVKPNLAKQIIIFNISIFTIGLFLACYHYGIQKGIFNETAYCNLNSIDHSLQSSEQIFKLLQSTEPVSCKEVNYTILGMSIAFWNIIGQSFLIQFSAVIIYIQNKAHHSLRVGNV